MSLLQYDRTTKKVEIISAAHVSCHVRGGGCQQLISNYDLTFMEVHMGYGLFVVNRGHMQSCWGNNGNNDSEPATVIIRKSNSKVANVSLFDRKTPLRISHHAYQPLYLSVIMPIMAIRSAFAIFETLSFQFEL